MARSKKRSDGRYVKTFTLNGKKYYAYGSTQKEAIENAEHKKSELMKGSYKKNADLTLDEYHDRWVEARLGTVRTATLRKQQFDYARVSKTVIDNAGLTLGQMLLQEIETQNIRDLQKAMLKATDPNGDTKYSTRTINDSINHLKHILKDAVLERAIVFNPASPVKALKRTEELARDTTHRALSIDETKAFLQASEDSYYYPVYKFLLSTGCRAGEAGALRYSDIDMKNGIIHIRRTLTKTELGNYVIGEEAKTKAGKRDIPMMDGVRKIISEQRQRNAILFNNGVSEVEGMLFRSPEGNLLSDTCINRDITRRCKKAEIEKFSAHALRDTFATRCVESGMNPKTLQTILGHNDISVTMNLYAHVMEETKVAEMDRVVIGF